MKTGRTGEEERGERESGGGQRGSQTAVTELFLGPDLAPRTGPPATGRQGKGKEVLLDIGVGGHTG